MSQNHQQGLVFLPRFVHVQTREHLHSCTGGQNARLRSQPGRLGSDPRLDSLPAVCTLRRLCKLCASVFSSTWWGWQHISHGSLWGPTELTHVNFLHFTNGETGAQSEITDQGHTASECSNQDSKPATCLEGQRFDWKVILDAPMNRASNGSPGTPRNPAIRTASGKGQKESWPKSETSSGNRLHGTEDPEPRKQARVCRTRAAQRESVDPLTTSQKCWLDGTAALRAGRPGLESQLLWAPGRLFTSLSASVLTCKMGKCHQWPFGGDAVIKEVHTSTWQDTGMCYVLASTSMNRHHECESQGWQDSLMAQEVRPFLVHKQFQNSKRALCFLFPSVTYVSTLSEVKNTCGKLLDPTS